MQTTQWLTVIIAAFVAWIGFLQWLTAREKAAFDLFDKRFKVYETVKHCVDQVSRNPLYFEKELERQFLRAVDEAYLLFGDHLYIYLDSLLTDITNVPTIDTQGPERMKVVTCPRDFGPGIT